MRRQQTNIKIVRIFIQNFGKIKMIRNYPPGHEINRTRIDKQEKKKKVNNNKPVIILLYIA